MDIDAGSESKALFAQVQFYIVLTDTIGVDQAEAVSFRRVPNESKANFLHIACESAQREWCTGSTTGALRRKDTFGRCHSCHFQDHRLPWLRCRRRFAQICGQA